MNGHPQSISTFNIASGAYQTFTALYKPILKLTIVSIFLPLIGFDLLLSQSSKQTSDFLKGLSDQILREELKTDFQAILAGSSSYFTPYLLLMCLLTLIFFAAYMGLIKVALAHEEERALPTARAAFFWGLRQLFPKGILLILIIALLNLEQFVWGPFRILSMLILMAPVLYAAESQRLGNSLHQALTLKYVDTRHSTVMNVALTLIIFGAFLFFFETLLALVSRVLLNGDQWMGIGRTLWQFPFFNFPFTSMFLCVHVLTGLGYAFLLATLPLFTVKLYTRTKIKTLS